MLMASFEGVYMEEIDIRPIIESLIFVSESPLTLGELVQMLPEFSEEAILEGIKRLKEDYEKDSKGIEIVEVAGGYQFRTKPNFSKWIIRLKKIKPVKLSQSALETLAIIAYRQPITRPAIEEIRGVDSGWVIRSLLEKGFIKITGRKDLPCRPIIYGTTKEFLEIFGLNTLSDLPTLKELQPPPMPQESSRQEILNFDSDGFQTEKQSTPEDLKQ